MPDLPWFPWWPGDAARSFRGLSDLVECALRRAYDESWMDQMAGVGTLADWVRWGRPAPEAEAEFLTQIQARCVQQPDTVTWVHLRLARTWMAQEMSYRQKVAAGRSSGESRKNRTAAQRSFNVRSNGRSTLAERALRTEQNRDTALPPTPKPNDLLTGPLPWERK